MYLELGPCLGDGYFDCLEYAIGVARPGTALEFGVATGKTLGMIADSNKFESIGFDSFEGLPEHWRDGFPKGFFSGDVPDVMNAHIVVGLFEDTLPEWVKNNNDKLNTLSLIHIDCDLFSSTQTILQQLEEFIAKDVVIVFDEYHGYYGWMMHEHRAWSDFVEKTNVKFDVLGYGPEQLVVRIK
jgi:hypothetical protein